MSLLIKGAAAGVSEVISGAVLVGSDEREVSAGNVHNSVLCQVGGLNIGPGQIAVVSVRVRRTGAVAASDYYGFKINDTIVASTADGWFPAGAAEPEEGILYFWLMPSDTNYGGSLAGFYSIVKEFDIQDTDLVYAGSANFPSGNINSIALLGISGHAAATLYATDMQVRVFDAIDVGCNEDEYTTSLAGGDNVLSTVDGLSIPAGTQLMGVFEYRQTYVGAPKGAFGLAVNGTPVVYTGDIQVPSATDEGMAVFWLQPGEADYRRPVVGICGTRQQAYTEYGAWVDLPIATITSISVVGNAGNAANTVGSRRLRIYKLANMFSDAGSDLTERTTNSTLADGGALSSVTGLDISGDHDIMLVFTMVKTAGAADSAYIGVKINGTQVLSTEDATAIRSGWTNNSNSGMVAINIRPAKTGYLVSLVGADCWGDTGESAHHGQEGWLMPVGNINSISLTGKVDNAAITLKTKDMHVYVTR